MIQTSGFAALMVAMAVGAHVEEPKTIDVWAEDNMIIPKDTGAAEPGPYRISRTPFARQIMRCLSTDHPCRRVVVRAASQMTKTQVGLNFLGSVIDQTPGNVLVLLPTDRLTKRVSARVSKTVEAVACLKAKVASPRSRDARNTIDTKEYPGGTMYIVTAGSAANLAEIPARYIWGDEVSRWPKDVNGEGGPLQIVGKRTSTFQYSSKEYYTSSPTEEGEDEIDNLMAQSTASVYKVPCPHCGERIVLAWEIIRYQVSHDDIVDRAWAVCPECAAEIDEHQKSVMLPAGEWVATQSGDGITEGFDLPATYFPIGGPSWATLAKEFVQAQKQKDAGDSREMRVFWNTRLARSFKEVGEKLQADVLRARAGGYQLRLVPWGALLIVAAVDTQDDRLECFILAIGRGEQMWVVDHHVILGSPGEAEVWERLDDWRARPVLHESGQLMGISACAVDTGGHHAHDVYNYCRQRESQRVYAIKGDGADGKPIKGKSSLMDVNYEGRVLASGVRLWFIGSNQTKDLLANRLRLQLPGPGYIHFPDGLTKDFFEQLTAEERRKVITPRGTVWRWKKVVESRRNEILDLMQMCIFAAYAIDVHKYTDVDWLRLEMVVQPVQRDMLIEAVQDPKAPITADLPGTIGALDWKRGAGRG